MFDGGGIKLMAFLGASLLGHGLALYAWPGPTQPAISGSSGSYAVALVPSVEDNGAGESAPPSPATTHSTRPEPGAAQSGSAGETSATAAESTRATPASQPAPNRSQVLAAIEDQYRQHFYYPPLAWRHGIEGRVVLGFAVEADGQIQNARVLRSSGNAILDKAALEALLAIENMAHLSAQLHGQSLVMELPVLYQLQ